MMDAKAAEKFSGAMNHLAYALRDFIEAQETERKSRSEEEQIGRIMLYIVSHPEYASMVEAHGPRLQVEPTWPNLLTFMTRVSSLANGVDPEGCHNGATRSIRVASATLLRDAIRMEFPRVFP